MNTEGRSRFIHSEVVAAGFVCLSVPLFVCLFVFRSSRKHKSDCGGDDDDSGDGGGGDDGGGGGDVGDDNDDDDDDKARLTCARNLAVKPA